MAIPDLPAVVDALVLDANCMPKGRFSRARLEDMLDVIGAGDLEIEVWVPEPVLWEWAEHVHGDIKATASPYKKALGHAKSAGFQIADDDGLDPALDDVGSVVEHIADVLSSYEEVEVLWCRDYPEAAILGLRDQVLLTGAGRRKPGPKGEGVKTGAADSAAFRLVERRATHLPAILLFSGDRDAKAYFDGRDAPVIIPDEWSRLKGALLNLQPAGDMLTSRLSEVISEALVSNDASIGADTIVVGAEKAFRGRLGPRDRYLEITTALTAVEAVQRVSEVAVDRKEGFGSALADVTVHLDATGVWWNDTDDRLEHEFEGEADVPAQVLVSVTRDGSDWEVLAEAVYILTETDWESLRDTT